MAAADVVMPRAGSHFDPDLVRVHARLLGRRRARTGARRGATAGWAAATRASAPQADRGRQGVCARRRRWRPCSPLASFMSRRVAVHDRHEREATLNARSRDGRLEPQQHELGQVRPEWPRADPVGQLLVLHRNSERDHSTCSVARSPASRCKSSSAAAAAAPPPPSPAATGGARSFHDHGHRGSSLPSGTNGSAPIVSLNMP